MNLLDPYVSPRFCQKNQKGVYAEGKQNDPRYLCKITGTPSLEEAFKVTMGGVPYTVLDAYEAVKYD
eukprot:SAG22_NODE_15_length_32914_cov_20.713546_14_plen_67_part_00